MNEDEWKKQIGRRLRKIHMRLGYRKGKEFAELIGIKYTTWNGYERGQNLIPVDAAMRLIHLCPGMSDRFSLKTQIAAELYRAFERFDAPPELLAVVGSYGDTLSDEEVLRLLREWNQIGKILHERQ